MDTPKLKILLLGPPEVTLEDRPVLIKRRLNRALLFYLAAQNNPVTREEICNLFWPDAPEEIAKKNLREALSRLRTSIGFTDLIFSEGEQLFLNPKRIWVDYREMDRLITPLMSSSEMHRGSALPEWMVAQLKEVFALCRANRFMQGTTLNSAAGFENWMELTNQAYRYSRIKIVDRLIDHYISGGNLEEALIWLGKGIDINPFDEDWNYLALICLRDTGRIQEMIDYITYMEKLYQQQEEELPARFTAFKTDAIARKEIENHPPTDWPEQEEGEPPFICREHELELLNQALRKRGVLLVQGEEGIGKTRLLKQFYITQPYSPALLYCRSQPLGRNTPFMALTQPLRDQIQEVVWQALEPSDRQLLSLFYYHVLHGTEGYTLPVPAGEPQRVLENVFYAFLNLLKITASNRPLLFVLDDAMWMDQASISLISFLIEHKFFDQYGLLVILVSPEGDNPELDALLQRRSRSRKLETIRLAPLQNREIGLFMQRIFGKTADEDLVKKMHCQTGGNPFYLIECLRAMQQKNISSDQLSDFGACSPPESIVRLVRGKMNLLEKASAAVLSAAAVLGRTFYIDVVEEMTGITDEALVAALNELSLKGFISANLEDRTEGSYVFSREVEREITLDQLGPAEKRRLHLRAAKALLSRRPRQPAFAKEIALHFETAGETQPAVKAWLEAGRHARSIFSKDETYLSYGRALELIDKLPAGYDESVIYQVVNEWGNYAHDHDDSRTCEKIYQRCLEVGEAMHSLLLIGTGLSGLGRAADFLYEYEKSAEYFQRAIFYLSNTEYDAELIKALSRLGIMQFGMDEYTRAYELLTDALKRDPATKDQDSLDNRVNILSYICFLHIFFGEPGKAEKIATEMARLSVLVKRRSARVQGHALLAMAQYYNGRVQEALLTFRVNHPMAETLQVRFWLSLLELVAAMAYLHNGDLDKSWYFIDRVHRREANYPQEKLFIQAVKIKGDIFRSLGANDKARGYYDQVFRSNVVNYPAVESRSLAAVMLAEERKNTDALELIQRSIEEAKQKNLAGIGLKARMYALLLFLEKTTFEEFEHQTGELQQEISRRELLNHDVFESWVPAVSAELRGDQDRALAGYCELQQRMAASQNVWMEFLALRKIIGMTKRKDDAGSRARTRVKELLAGIALHAESPAIKGSFQKFRNKWRRYVNDKST
ncbi:MAG: AAA family ATPase [Anaerolineaceae bacterium]|nr:AAA family ATPase [Anaerolineaceae bacterium]